MAEKIRMKSASQEDFSETRSEPDCACGCASMHPAKKFFMLSFAIVGALLLVLVGWGIASLVSSGSGQAAYAAVYMASGDVYFGKLTQWPSMTIADPWYLQRTVDENNQPRLNLVPLASVPWGPMGEMHLSPSQILFWTPLDTEGEFVKQLMQLQAGGPDALGQSIPAPAGAENTIPVQNGVPSPSGEEASQ